MGTWTTARTAGIRVMTGHPPMGVLGEPARLGGGAREWRLWAATGARLLLAAVWAWAALATISVWVPESRSWVLSWEFARAVTWSR
jgi:hypothetical protein